MKFAQTVIAIALAAAGAQAFAAIENKFTAPKMVTETSKLSKDAEMELAGYERVGSYKSVCETDFRRKSLDSNKELKSEACTIYKERGKDLPSVSIN